MPDEAEKQVSLEEVTVVKEVNLAGNASLGIAVDSPRNRVLVVHADVFGNRYGALAAYDLSTWNRLFLTQLSGPSELLRLLYLTTPLPSFRIRCFCSFLSTYVKYR